MQSDLKLESSPAKAGCRSAGNIMPFKEQHVDTPFGQCRRRRKPSVTGTNHNGIIFFHSISLIGFFVWYQEPLPSDFRIVFLFSIVFFNSAFRIPKSAFLSTGP
jgi:hypothetical protein